MKPSIKASAFVWHQGPPPPIYQETEKIWSASNVHVKCEPPENVNCTGDVLSALSWVSLFEKTCGLQVRCKNKFSRRNYVQFWELQQSGVICHREYEVNDIMLAKRFKPKTEALFGWFLSTVYLAGFLTLENLFFSKEGVSTSRHSYTSSQLVYVQAKAFLWNKLKFGRFYSAITEIEGC